MNDVIVAKNVRKEFGKKEKVLQDVDLRVKENEILVLMGPNGVGKTVFLCCITGGLHPSRGKVRVFGHPSPSWKVRKKVGFLLQGAVALPYLTGRENIKYYSRLHEKSTDRWEELVKRFKIEEDLDRVVKDYSGGMKRKIEVISTLSIDTPLYILDEPTAGLDLSMVRVFHDILLGLKEGGKTIVLSTHNPLNAEIADRIAFMREVDGGGDIVAVDTPQALLESVPPIIRLTATTARLNQKIRDFLLGDRVFEKGGESIGFLHPEDQEIDKIKEIAREENPQCKVERMDPTYTDMFNYYTYVWKKE